MAAKYFAMYKHSSNMDVLSQLSAFRSTIAASCGLSELTALTEADLQDERKVSVYASKMFLAFLSFPPWFLLRMSWEGGPGRALWNAFFCSLE